MSKSKILDLRNIGDFDVWIDTLEPAPTIHTVRLTNLGAIAGTHTLTLGSNTYTLGSGLAISGNDLLWTFDRNDFTAAKTVGKLENNSTTNYYRLKVTLCLK